MDASLESLIKDINVAAQAGHLEHIKTIYIGGGTPTHFGHGRLVELAYLLSLRIKLEQVEEYTIEANPESLTPALIRDLYALGANRLSMGVQSFVNSELVTLGRIHDAARVTQALQEARERFDNISLDLICGIPGQTLESWQYSLNRALSFDPEHLSIYPLQIEEGTSLFQAIKRGELQGPDEDELAEFLEFASRKLVSRGYHRYEVASYAKPGQESRHNSNYWRGVSYLGIGRGAASMCDREDGTRERWKNGEEPELLSAKEAVAEDLLLAMRTSSGVSDEELKAAEDVFPLCADLFNELQELELVAYKDGRFIPTEKGWLLGNELYGRIWALV